MGGFLSKLIPCCKSKLVRSNDDIKEAVKMWVSDPVRAKIKYGDISEWDTSRVTNMHKLFNGYQFQGDISKWNVSSVTNMDNMFRESQFDGDIRRWRVSPSTTTDSMFDGCSVDYIQFWQDREERWVRRRPWIMAVAPFIRNDGSHATTDSPIQMIFNVPGLIEYITRYI